MNQKKKYSYPQVTFRVKPEMKSMVETLAAQHNVSPSALVRAAIYQLSAIKNYHERNKLVHSYKTGPGCKSEIELETPAEKILRDEKSAFMRERGAFE
ncbi:hypothetical protein ES703_53091 [subsurface metagenome]